MRTLGCVAALSSDAGTGPLDERLAANRAAWDARVPVHAASRFYDVEGRLRDKQGPHRWELEALGDVTGLRLVHLQCHFGLDTLAWARAGAQVVGLDLSPNGIETARSLAERSGLSDKTQFVCADVYDAVNALHGAAFDIVYVSTGALCWLPNVDRWPRTAAGSRLQAGRASRSNTGCWQRDRVDDHAGSSRTHTISRCGSMR